MLGPVLLGWECPWALVGLSNSSEFCRVQLQEELLWGGEAGLRQVPELSVPEGFLICSGDVLGGPT